MDKYFKKDSPIRRCTLCKLVLKRIKFYKNKSTLSGLDNFCKRCRLTTTERNRRRYKQTSRFVMPAKKIISQGNMRCVCCGNKNSKWLHFDHIIPIKKADRKRISINLISRKIVLNLIPITNYQLLCANCNFAKGKQEKCPIEHALD